MMGYVVAVQEETGGWIFAKLKSMVTVSSTFQMPENAVFQNVFLGKFIQKTALWNFIGNFLLHEFSGFCRNWNFCIAYMQISYPYILCVSQKSVKSLWQSFNLLAKNDNSISLFYPLCSREITHLVALVFLCVLSELSKWDLLQPYEGTLCTIAGALWNTHITPVVCPLQLGTISQP